MTLVHLKKLEQLEPNNNINVIHKYLCDSGDDNLVKISSTITNLYEVAESERELEERKKHGIDEKTYRENAEWKRSFFVNPKPKNVKNNKVEHEYFLNLLYSLSFTLYLARKNYNGFLKAELHLSKYEYSLNTLENLYTVLDTLAVLIYLTCGLNKSVTDMYFSALKGDLKSTHPYTENFDLKVFSINKYPLNMLNKIRNMCVHRPFLDWDIQSKIVLSPSNLSKVRSVCERDGLYNNDIHDFIKKCFEETTNILKISLDGVLKTYRQRLENDQAVQWLHCTWEDFLAG